MEQNSLLQKDDSGDVVDLASFIFAENKEPGRVQVETASLGSVVQQFVFFCELYFTGAKLYNGLPISERLTSLADLRKSTAEFLATRMQQALNVLPSLRIVDGAEDCNPQSPLQFQFQVDHDTLEGNVLRDVVCNFELRMQYAYA